jgi:hypothetical protein
MKTVKVVVSMCLLWLGAATAGMAAASDDADAGFELIFDGKTFNGWRGDPVYWRVENGALVGEVTPETILKKNSWIIWEDGEVEDFELKLDYRVSQNGNSGVGYRCSMIPDEPYAVRGYQADIHGGDDWTGINYEERGRAVLAVRGMKTVIHPGQPPTVVAVFGGHADFQRFVKKQDWNEYHIIVHGNRMQHFLNGVLMNDVEDLDPVNGKRKGLLGVQVHVGPPMKIEYRNIRLKHLKSTYESAWPTEEGVDIPVMTLETFSSLEHILDQAKRIEASDPLSGK